MITADKLKMGDVVIVYKLIEDDLGRFIEYNFKPIKGRYIVTYTSSSAGQEGHGGMSEGSPDSCDVVLKKLKDNGKYSPKAENIETSYSDRHGEEHILKFKKVDKMESYWRKHV